MINIETITGGSIGTNCYLIEEDGEVVLVDFVPEAEKIIKEKNYKVVKILITHIHFDHIEKLALFQKKYDFEIYISQYGYNNINNPEFNLLILSPVDPEKIDKVNLDNTKIVGQNDLINWKNHSLKVILSPGHSPDSVMYIFEEKKCVFSGDTLFYQSVGRTDLPGSSHEKILDSINKLFEVISEDYAIYPGHGPWTFAGYEKRNNPFLI